MRQKKAISPIISIILLLLITIAIAGAGYSYLSTYWSGLTGREIQVLDASCLSGKNRGKIVLKNIGTSNLSTSDITVINAQTGQDINNEVVWGHKNLGAASDPGLSCLHILENGAPTGDGTYWIDPDGAGGSDPFQVYCDMTLDGGGWTLIMKSQSDTNTFHYSSGYWNSAGTLNEGDLSLTRGDSKYKSFDELAFSDIRGCVGSAQSSCLIRQFGSSKSSALALFSEAEVNPCETGNDGGLVTFANFEAAFGIDMYNGPCEQGPKWNKPDCGGGGGDNPVRWGVYTDEDASCASNNEAMGWGLTNDGSAPGSAGSGGYTPRMSHVGKDAWLWVRGSEITSSMEITVQPGETATLVHTCSGLCSYKLVLGSMAREAMLEC